MLAPVLNAAANPMDTECLQRELLELMFLWIDIEIEVFFIFQWKYKRANVKKNKQTIESRRVSEANDNGEETVEYSSAIPEPVIEGIFQTTKYLI